jgi:hypothetical protein
MTFKDFCESYFADLDYIENLTEQINCNTEKLKQLEIDARSEDLYPSAGIAKYGKTEGAGKNNLSVVEKSAVIHHAQSKEIKIEITRTRSLISEHVKERANLMIHVSPFKIALQRLNEIDRQIITLKYGVVRCGKKKTTEEIALIVDLTSKTIYDHLTVLARDFPALVESIQIKRVV